MSLGFLSARRLAPTVSLACLFLLAGCSSGWRPDEEKSVYKSSYEMTADGYYTVRRGDTLHAIAFHFGMDWRDIAAWNIMVDPERAASELAAIFPDQKLRLSAPKGRSSQKKPSVAGTRTPAAPKADSGTAARTSANTTVVRAAPGKSATSTTYDKLPESGTRAPTAGADPVSWQWPAEGRVVSNFKPGDPARKACPIEGIATRTCS